VDPVGTTFLSLQGVSKHFGGVAALSNFDFELEVGEIHCLVGGNGSGKSTLIKIISGMQAPDPGAGIAIGGNQFPRLTPVESSRLGIQVIYQDLSLFPNLTVAENIAVGEHRAGVKWVRWPRVREIATAAVKRIGVAIDLDTIVSELSIANRQLVAICRAIAADARLVIMDEPTASLTRHEVDALLAMAVELKRRDIAVMFVSHRFDEILEIADRVTVMRDGVKLGTFSAEGMTESQLSVLMTGESYSYETRQREILREQPVLKVASLSRKDEYEDIAFALYPGEVLGLTGLLGSGRTELALTLFGMNKPDRGEIKIDGLPVAFGSNRDAVNLGVAYVPEDRLSLSLVLDQSIDRNMILPVQNELTNPLGLFDARKRGALIEHWTRELRIKSTDPQNAVSTLSGGNQQRVVIAKWLASQPRILILDSPTVGVDLKGKDGIYQIIRTLAEAGISVILISDEIPEVLYHSDRILVMGHGRISSEFQAHQTSEQELRQAVNAG